jgi:hypothetical protein
MVEKVVIKRFCYSPVDPSARRSLDVRLGYYQPHSAAGRMRDPFRPWRGMVFTVLAVVGG